MNALYLLFIWRRKDTEVSFETGKVELVRMCKGEFQEYMLITDRTQGA